MKNLPSHKELSDMDEYNKLTVLENLIFNKLVNKSNLNKNFNTNLKALLEIIKLKHKLKPDNEELTFFNFFESDFTNNNDMVTNIKDNETTKITTNL